MLNCGFLLGIKYCLCLLVWSCGRLVIVCEVGPGFVCISSLIVRIAVLSHV